VKCVLCGRQFGPEDAGYVRGSISGEVMELLPSGPKQTGQIFDHKNIIMCVSHFEDIPKHIAENLRQNAAKRKETA
jgi:hypothetical protein